MKIQLFVQFSIERRGFLAVVVYALRTFWWELRCPRIRDFRSNDADDNENVQNTTGLISKTTTSHVHHTFLYISFPFLHDYDVKMPHFTFYRGRKQATTKFFSLSELEYCPLKFSFRRVRLQLTK